LAAQLPEINQKSQKEAYVVTLHVEKDKKFREKCPVLVNTCKSLKSNP
jgi:hypothetical protein